MCEIITLQSQDGQDFQVELGIKELSGTIKDVIDDAGIKNAIPLPNISGSILAKVIDYYKLYQDNKTITTNKNTDDNKDSKLSDMAPWEEEFCNIEQSVIFDLILAANYLDIKSLLDLMCRTVANMIKGKTPEEIRKTFNIKNDFTAEEEEQVRKENEWCEER